MIAPPQTHEVLPAVKGLLQAGNLLGFSPNGGLVVSKGNQLDIEKDSIAQPTPAANGFWWRVILMPVIHGLAAPREYLYKVRGFQFRTRVDVMAPDDEGFNSEKFLEFVQAGCYQIINGENIQMDHAKQEYHINRIHFPSQMFLDKKKGFQYNSAEYLIGLGPKT